MSHLVQPVEGDERILNDLANAWNLSGFQQIGLFNSPITPSTTDTLATYTAHEATFTGYTRQTLNSWGSAAPDGSGRGVIVHPNITFTCSIAPVSTETIYGYFVTDGTDLYWAQVADTPIDITLVGDSVIVTPRYTQKTEFTA